MKTQRFLEHHGIAVNPFAEEDAQNDPVFKEHCIDSIYHPTWDKVFGDPADPATSIVFGEKGAGKTAMRLQIMRHLTEYNRAHGAKRVFVVQYDDFNPFLDHFRSRLGRRKRTDRILAEWKLWDHMDAILSLAVTGLVDRILNVRQPSAAVPLEGESLDISRLDRHQARDLLLLAACYDSSTAETIQGRWKRLRQQLRFRTWLAQYDLALGFVISAAVAAGVVASGDWTWLAGPWPYVATAAGWVPWLARSWKRLVQAANIRRQVRVGNLQTGPLRKLLMHFSSAELAGQPLPQQPRTDDRYELLTKFQGLLQTLGFCSIVVLVDRLDEPHLVTGSTDAMRAVLWPMLDNKFLKHPGIGFKLMLPIELSQLIDRETREFMQRARLDKQNLIPSLEWTGEALYDVAVARLAACALPGQTPVLSELFDASVSERRLIEAFRGLRVPRHLFKFFYRLLIAHCNAYTDESPEWKISSERFETVLALYLRDQDQVDRGLRAG